MVKIHNPLGSVTLTSEYFANLVGSIATSCYGVSGMAVSGPIDGVRSVLFGRDFPEKGVRVFESGGRLEIELHIRVVYGVNIAVIVRSISEKVRYAVEEATNLSVKTINVYVDEMVAE